MEPSHVLSHRVFSRQEKNFLKPDLESSDILLQGYVDSFDLPSHLETHKIIFWVLLFFLSFSLIKPKKVVILVILVKDKVDFKVTFVKYTIFIQQLSFKPQFANSVTSFAMKAS